MVQCGNNHSMVESVVTQKLYSDLVCCISPWWNPMVKSDACIPPFVKTGAKRENVYFGIAGIYETRSFFSLPGSKSTWAIFWSLASQIPIYPNFLMVNSMVQSPWKTITIFAWQTATHFCWSNQKGRVIPLDHGRKKERFLLKWVFILLVSQLSFIFMSIIFHLYALII